MPEAVATFSESTPAAIPILSRKSTRSNASSLRPAPSVPKINALRRGNPRRAAEAMDSPLGSSATRV